MLRRVKFSFRLAQSRTLTSHLSVTHAPTRSIRTHLLWCPWALCLTRLWPLSPSSPLPSCGRKYRGVAPLQCHSPHKSRKRFHLPQYNKGKILPAPPHLFLELLLCDPSYIFFLCPYEMQVNLFFKDLDKPLGTCRTQIFKEPGSHLLEMRSGSLYPCLPASVGGQAPDSDGCHASIHGAKQALIIKVLEVSLFLQIKAIS